MRKYILSVFLLVFCSVLTLKAQTSYYNSIDGTKGGETLKNVLYNLIRNMSTVSYGSGENNTWGAFYTTDAIVSGGMRQVADMYSDVVRYFGSKGEAVSGMNIEHSVPKSWWGSTKNNAYEDLHHLNPSDETANSRKSNYPMAELGSVSWTNGITSVGKSVIAGTSQNAFEPADEYKGDFARTYMYMFTCYQNLTWQYTWMNYENSSYPTLKPWAVELLMKWHRQDPVSQKEIARNNAVYVIQGNRNPYVDYPRLADFVWGDSINNTFYLYGGVEDGSGNQTGSSSSSGGSDGDDISGGGDEGGNTPLYAANFTLVTNASSLSVGDTIIIASGSVALSTNQKSNNRGEAAIEIASNNVEIAYISSDVQKIVLEQGATSGTFAFNVGDGYLYAASSSKNLLRTQTAIDANASWLITIGGDALADIAAQGDNERNLLRYNTSASLFSCYKSGQELVNIYAKSRAVDSSVDNIEYNSNKVVDVYNIAGVCVRRQVTLGEATEGLPKGLYIVDRKKYYVK